MKKYKEVLKLDWFFRNWWAQFKLVRLWTTLVLSNLFYSSRVSLLWNMVRSSLSPKKHGDLLLHFDGLAGSSGGSRYRWAGAPSRLLLVWCASICRPLPLRRSAFYVTRLTKFTWSSEMCRALFSPSFPAATVELYSPTHSTTTSSLFPFAPASLRSRVARCKGERRAGVGLPRTKKPERSRKTRSSEEGVNYQRHTQELDHSRKPTYEIKYQKRATKIIKMRIKKRVEKNFKKQYWL